MRILHLFSSLDPKTGGPPEVIRQFATALNDDAHSSGVLCFDAPDSPWLSKFPFPVFALGAAGSGGLSHPVAEEWLRDHAKEYDAVIAHGLWQFQTQLAHCVLKPLGRPYFVYPHGMLDPWFKRGYPIKHLKKVLYWRWREAAALRDATAVLFTCEEERVLARQTFRPYRVREAVSPLGIEPPPGSASALDVVSGTSPEISSAKQTRQLDVFRDAFPELREKRVLLFLGRLHDKKGPDLLIKAFGELLSSQPTTINHQPPLHLVLAGPAASDAYLRELTALAAVHCPPDTISFPGMLSGYLKWGALRAAELFVLPSHQENFGIAVAEALACGTPVIISSKVNIWREIEADGAGLICADELGSVTSTLEKWIGFSEAERGRFAAAALTCFESRYEIKSAAARLVEVLQQHL